MIRQHIELYVNKFSVRLGEEGKAAVRELFLQARKSGIFQESVAPMFRDQ